MHSDQRSARKPSSGQVEITVQEIRSSVDKNAPEFQLLSRISNLPRAFLDDGTTKTSPFWRRYLIHAWQKHPTANQTLAVAACGVAAPGSYGRVWGPYVDAQAPPSTMSQLFEAISGAFEKTSTNHLLAVIDKTDQETSNRYRKHGYAEIHEVLHLVCVQQQLRRTESSLRVESPTRLILTPVVECSFAEFLNLIEATFQHTDDCPGLDEQSTLNEVQSRWSRTPPARRAQSWYRASIAPHGEPLNVGCLVLDVDPGSRNVELIYLGLIPEHRGKGLGNELILRAQEISCQAGKDTMTVSVDASHHKALRGYVAQGFIRYAESMVFAKTLE